MQLLFWQNIIFQDTDDAARFSAKKAGYVVGRIRNAEEFSCAADSNVERLFDRNRPLTTTACRSPWRERISRCCASP